MAIRNWKDIPLFKGVTDEQWNDWHWQVEHRLTTVEEIAQKMKHININNEQLEAYIKLVKKDKRKMNICFFIGKIISDIDFKFIVNNRKYNSIVIFQIESNNKSIITLKGYNEIADFCYRNLEKNNIIIAVTFLNSKLEGIVEKIVNLNN